MAIDQRGLAVLQRRQEDVAARRQLLSLGLSSAAITRRVSAGRWQRLHPGVYALHSGPVVWRARARAALLHAGPESALSHGSAAHLQRLRHDAPDVLEVSVPAHHAPGGGDDLVVHRRRRMPYTYGSLRVVGRPDTVLDLCERLDSLDDVVGVVSAAARSGTPASAIARAAALRSRLRHRGLLRDLLEDVVAGVESPMEYRYRHHVERAHGLPTAELQDQVRAGGRWIRSDCRYAAYRLRVELDGQLGHPGGRTDADTWRDNAVLLERQDRTLRYRWRHVMGGRCATALQVAAGLRAGGWPGTPTPCGPTCAVP